MLPRYGSESESHISADFQAPLTWTTILGDSSLALPLLNSIHQNETFTVETNKESRVVR